MSGKMSRNKGAAGEREWRDVLRTAFNCPDAHRGCQHSGGPDSPDVAKGIAGTHVEVKRTETLSLYPAMQQAIDDAGEGVVPYVAHRRNKKDWLVVVRASDLLELGRRVVQQVDTQ